MRPVRLVLAGIFLCLSFANQFAADGKSEYRPVRVATQPVIDGELTDEAWQNAPVISEFLQQEPSDGLPVSERTEVRVCYDSRNLYFGIKAWESEPQKLVRRNYDRDGYMPADDSFLIAIDSNNDGRTAFVFEMNTLGAKTDIELSDAGAFNIDWDSIWEYSVRVNSDHYVVEAAIPLFVLRFSSKDELDMGLLLMRRIKKNNEESFWPYLSRDHEFSAVSQYGKLTGLKGVERGKDLEVKPYVTAGITETPGDRVYKGDAGLDLKWGVTPGLTTDLTFNTDFAQVESDELQVNLTRFSLFYPEKREFFLENAQLFTFGLLRRSEVFFSRRIGIRDGQEVPIIAGARAYGLVGSTNVGLLTMQTAGQNGFDGENFSVARVKQNVLGRSYVGGIVASRQGWAPDADTTAGADFMFLFDNNVMIHGLTSRSGRSGYADDQWFTSVGALQDTDSYNWEFRYDDIGRHFDPAMGFVARPDQRTVTLFGRRSPRPGWKGVRQLHLAGLFRNIQNHSGELETRTFNTENSIVFSSEDAASIVLDDQQEFVPATFYLTPEVFIPAGRYRNRGVAASFVANQSRKVSGHVVIAGGSFFEGTLRQARSSLQVSPYRWLHLSLESDLTSVDVPSGSFDSSITRGLVSYYISPDFSTRFAVQHSSLTDELIANFRIRWIYKPGSEMWLVYNETRGFQFTESLVDRALMLKIVHNLSF